MEGLDGYEGSLDTEAFDKIYKKAKLIYKALEKNIEEKYPSTKPKKFTVECKSMNGLPKVGLKDNTLLSLDFIEKKQPGEQLLLEFDKVSRSYL
jgi:hypothetical protein